MTDMLVVAWDRRRIAAIQTTGQGPSSVTASWSGDWPESAQPTNHPAAAGAWLKEQWTAAGLTAKAVWVVLPREEVILRHLELPEAPDDDLPDMVRFQAASRSSVPLDQTALDFIPLGRFPGRVGRDVLAGTIPKPLLDGVQQTFTAAERELTGVSFSSQALGEWGEQHDRVHAGTLPGHEADSTLVLSWDGGRVDLAIVCGRELTFAHAARITPPEGTDPTATILAEVSRTLVAGQRLRPGLRIDHGWVVGEHAGLAKALAERYECSFTAVDPLGTLATSPRVKALAKDPATAALLLGVRVTPVTPTVNFLKPRQRPPKRDPRKQQYAIAAAAALGLGFLLIGGGLWRLNRLDQLIAQAYNTKTELETRVNGGQPVVTAATVLGDWALRDVPQLTLLAELEALFPGELERPYLGDYKYAIGVGETRATISGTAIAKAREDIVDMQEELSADGDFKVLPKEVKSTSNDDKYPFSTQLSLVMLKTPQKPVTPAGDPAKVPDKTEASPAKTP